MKSLRLVPLAALAVMALAVASCQSATVSGPGGESLTATTPRSVTIRRGNSVPLEVGIERENYTGPVTVSLVRLPKGVAADQSSITGVSTSATFILTADAAADLVTNQALSVTVADEGGRQVTQFVKLTVTE